MGAARPGLLGNALGSLAIVGIVALIAIGLPLYDGMLPAARAVPIGVPYPVGAGVTVVPPDHASLDLTETRPSFDRGTALFTLGTVRYAVVVAPFRGTLAEALTRLRGKIASRPGYRVTSAERPVRTDGGVVGASGVYDSPGRMGEYAVFVAAGLAVEVTASGPEAELRRALPRVQTSLRTILFGAGP